MSDAVPRLMDADEFLVWCLDQEDAWELVDGVPTLKFDNGPNMMAGGTRRHARVTSNLIIQLGQRLAGGPCTPYPGDLAVRVSHQRIRRPDVSVDCAAGDGDDLEAAEPRVLFEVLSPSTRGIDLVRKSDEYRQLPSVRHIVLIEPDRAKVLVWSSDGETWSSETIEGLDATLELPAIDVILPLVKIYAGVPFAA